MKNAKNEIRNAMVILNRMEHYFNHRYFRNSITEMIDAIEFYKNKCNEFVATGKIEYGISDILIEVYDLYENFNHIYRMK